MDNWAWEWNLGIWRKYSWFSFQGKIILASFLEPAKYEANDSPWFRSKIQDYSLTIGGRSPSESLLHFLHCLFKAYSTQIINDRPLKPLTRRKCIDNLSSLHKNPAQIFIKPKLWKDTWIKGRKEDGGGGRGGREEGEVRGRRKRKKTEMSHR